VPPPRSPSRSLFLEGARVGRHTSFLTYPRTRTRRRTHMPRRSPFRFAALSRSLPRAAQAHPHTAARYLPPSLPRTASRTRVQNCTRGRARGVCVVCESARARISTALSPLSSGVRRRVGFGTRVPSPDRLGRSQGNTARGVRGGESLISFSQNRVPPPSRCSHPSDIICVIEELRPAAGARRQRRQV
jgi:hypothetical protein